MKTVRQKFRSYCNKFFSFLPTVKSCNFKNIEKTHVDVRL